MSSTRRGYDRHASDYYVTPQQPIKNFFSNFVIDEFFILKNIIALDPCAGGSEHDEMSYPTVLENEFNVVTFTNDIREDSLATTHFDYLTTDLKAVSDNEPFNLIITNPPFNIALEIIKKSLMDVVDGGYVVMLLRLNFLGSNERLPFFKENMPKIVYVHSKRMNFIPDWLNKKAVADGGKKMSGDSIEYAHFVWQKGFDCQCENTILKII